MKAFSAFAISILVLCIPSIGRSASPAPVHPIAVKPAATSSIGILPQDTGKADGLELKFSLDKSTFTVGENIGGTITIKCPYLSCTGSLSCNSEPVS